MPKKINVEQYATLVTESEWSEWQECPLWVPRRDVVKAKQLNGKKCTCFSKLQVRMPKQEAGHSFFAVFTPPVGTKYKKGNGVPFYWTTGMVALAESDLPLLRARYGSDACSVSILGSPAQKNFAEAIARASVSELRRDGTLLCEMFDIQGCGEGIFPIDSMRRLLTAAECGSVQGDENVLVLTYTRHAPNFPEGLLGAICDLGAILRGMDSVNKDSVTAFATKVSDILKCGASFGLGEAKTLLDEHVGIHPFVRLDVVLFLHWKYKAGAHDGRIDFNEIESNLASARELGLEDCCSRAIVALGQLSGFSGFAANYHALMRQRSRELKKCAATVKIVTR